MYPTESFLCIKKEEKEKKATEKCSTVHFNLPNSRRERIAITSFKKVVKDSREQLQ